MASISKRGSRWFVQVRRKGYAPLYKTFSTKTAAQAWAREQELKADRQDPAVDRKALQSLTLGDLIERYLDEVTPGKRSADTERLRLRKVRQHPIAQLALGHLEPSHIAGYRDDRLRTVKPGTIRRELSLIRNVLDVAERDWGVRLVRNPVALVSKPKANDARDRRLREGEMERLSDALQSTRNPFIRHILLLAIETGLRRSELLSLQWRHIDLASRTAHIPWSKTGKPRTIPLTESAVSIFSELRSAAKSERVFPISANAFRHAWERLRVRAGLNDLRFHDLRHEAISRFCELGLSIPEVAVISGHRDPRMLFRYAHLRPADLALKLARLTSGDGQQKEAA